LKHAKQGDNRLDRALADDIFHVRDFRRNPKLRLLGA
jgi:hypothetical protein